MHPFKQKSQMTAAEFKIALHDAGFGVGHGREIHDRRNVATRHRRGAQRARHLHAMGSPWLAPDSSCASVGAVGA
jgi:hypothetical protein